MGKKQTELAEFKYQLGQEKLAKTLDKLAQLSEQME